MNNHPTRDEGLIFYLDIARQQRTAGDHDLAAQLTVMGNMARGHDEIVVANDRARLGLGGTRNCEVLPDLVVVSNLEIASFPLEVFVEGICAEYCRSTDFIGDSKTGPALDVDVRLKNAISPKHDILLDDAEFTDHTTRANDSIRMNSGSGRHTRPRIYGHK